MINSKQLTNENEPIGLYLSREEMMRMFDRVECKCIDFGIDRPG